VTQLINEEWISAARARYDVYVAQYGEVPPAAVNPRLGMDIAEFGIDSNVACLRYGGFVPPLMTWHGVDTDVTADRGVEIVLSKHPETTIVDATAIGASVAPSMVRKAHNIGHSIRVIGIKASQSPTPGSKTEYGEFMYVRDQLWWAVREWLRIDPGAMLPPDEMLLEELKAPTYYINVRNSKLQVTDKDALRKALLRSPDRADALCLTFLPASRAKVVRAVG
jgi:hypothetical protein